MPREGGGDRGGGLRSWRGCGGLRGGEARRGNGGCERAEGLARPRRRLWGSAWGRGERCGEGLGLPGLPCGLQGLRPLLPAPRQRGSRRGGRWSARCPRCGAVAAPGAERRGGEEGTAVRSRGEGRGETWERA